jgi:hypothetical protein
LALGWYIPAAPVCSCGSIPEVQADASRQGGFLLIAECDKSSVCVCESSDKIQDTLPTASANLPFTSNVGWQAIAVKRQTPDPN